MTLSTRSLSALALLLLSGCASVPPTNVKNSCDIFREKPDWYEATKAVFSEYGAPIHVQLAFMHQESRFRHDAEPPRTYLLGFIPWFRPSSAYGYAQVKDETWNWYQEKTGNGGADRDDFEDAAYFIGWYVKLTQAQLGISKWDAYNQYLAYHEGHGGYRRKTFNQKPWLVKVARKVERQAKSYSAQLAKCRDELESRWRWWFW